MSATYQQAQDHLAGMMHGSTLNKVRNLAASAERAATNLLSRINPVETERIAPLNGLVYDDVFKYPLPSDYRALIDILPQGDRLSQDRASRGYSEPFDRTKGIKNKTLAIESNNGAKFLQLNWRAKQGKLLNAMNSLTDNGAWSIVGSATGLKAQTQYKISGNASIEFDVAASGDGIKNSTMSALDFTDEDEIADVFVWVYLPSAPTSITAVWGNDLTTKYWTAVAQTTQADGSAFQTGWNLLKFPWSTATETGTVDPAAIDSFKLTIAASSTLSNVRVDNIMVTIGRPFDIKYHSLYGFKDSSGSWEQRPSNDSSTIVFEGTSYNIFLYEWLMEAAQQAEGVDGQADIVFAQQHLFGDGSRAGLYSQYLREYPNQAKGATTAYGSLPRFQR